MRVSKITKGFAIAGVIAAIVVLGCAATHAWTDYLLILCPPALVTMAIDEPYSLWTIFEFIYIAALNAILYGLVGLAVSQIWSLLRRKVLA